jgi:hypothetical protein
VRRYFMQHLSTVLHGSLGSYLRDALHEDNVDVAACLFVPRAWAFSSLLLFAWWLLLLVRVLFFC